MPRRQVVGARSGFDPPTASRSPSSRSASEGEDAGGATVMVGPAAGDQAMLPCSKHPLDSPVSASKSTSAMP